MLACKGIFAKPAISQVRIAHGGAAAKAYAVRLSENIISRFTTKVNAFFAKAKNIKSSLIPRPQQRFRAVHQVFPDGGTAHAYI